MQNLLEFTQQIEKSLAVEEKQNQSDRQELSRKHELRTERSALYTKTAHQIIDIIVRPRMESLVGYFENASISSPDSQNSQCTSQFETRPRFPASTTLGFSVSHDADIENVDIVYTLQILPIFVKYDSLDTISFPLEALDEPRLAQWVEHKLLSFLDTYIQLGHIDQYQKQNLVIDPVCGMQVNKAFAISKTARDSQTYFFCSEECREKFVSQPE